MALILAGDIGGTKTLLRLVNFSAREGLQTLYENNYTSANYPHLLNLVQEFLEAAKAANQLNGMPPAAACFGIAGPVSNNTSELTNLKWSLSGDRLANDLNIPEVSLINDFAAVGYGVLGLTASDLHTLQVGSHQPRAPIGIIGAGTGLGEGFLTWADRSYQVHSSEGGHVDFAPRSDIEVALLQYLRTKHHRVSVERVVSGLGIVNIYQFLCEYHQANPSSHPIMKVVEAWRGGDSNSDAAAAIANGALQHTDDLAEQAMQIFVESYGAAAGNLALKLLPYGGLYISGGIAPKILPLMLQPNFMAAFKDKGRIGDLLDRIPVHIVLNNHVGLIGAALYASQKL